MPFFARNAPEMTFVELSEKLGYSESFLLHGRGGERSHHEEQNGSIGASPFRFRASSRVIGIKDHGLRVAR